MNIKSFVFGFVACLGLIVGGNMVLAPDIKYTSVHYGNPLEHGRVTSYIDGASYSPERDVSFAGGGAAPENLSEMLSDAERTFKTREFLEQNGIDFNDGVGEVVLSVRVEALPAWMDAFRF